VNTTGSQILREFKHLTKEPVVLGLILLCFGLLLWFIIYPLFSVLKTSVLDDGGNFVGLENYFRFFGNPYFREVLYNTLFISALATMGALILGTIFAYGMTRTDMPGKPLFMITGILPMITPPDTSSMGGMASSSPRPSPPSHWPI
jgi:iron(III) transport system permease protein